jgi:hypothetical protein
MAVTISGSGQIINKVATYTKTNKTLCNATTNTMTEQDTNFRVSITPTNSSSRFLVFLVINGGSTTGCTRFRIEYSTNGGSSWSFVAPVGDVDGSRTQSHCSLNINGDGNPMNSCSAEVLFAPATANTITFRVLMGADQPNYMMWNGSRNNSNDFLGQTATSTLRVMEISG